MIKMLVTVRGITKMKKVKILSHPTQIATIRLDDLEYDTTAEINEKIAKSQIRKWRKLRQEAA